MSPCQIRAGGGTPIHIYRARPPGWSQEDSWMDPAIILGFKNHGFYTKRFVHEGFLAFSTFLKCSGWRFGRMLGVLLGVSGALLSPSWVSKTMVFTLNASCTKRLMRFPCFWGVLGGALAACWASFGKSPGHF